MTREREFWRFVWLAGGRLPWSLGLSHWQAFALMVQGCATLIVARYTGWNLWSRAWCHEQKVRGRDA